MSDYGLVTGINRNIQFDTSRRMPGLREHDYAYEANWTEVESHAGFGGFVYPISRSYTISAIAIRPRTESFAIGYTDNLVGVTGYIGGIAQNIPRTIEYAIYSLDINYTHPIPAWGLMTYDGNGNVIFNSDINYLKIVDIIDINRSKLMNYERVTINHNVLNPFYIIPNNNYHFHIYHSSDHTIYSIVFGTVGIRKISATSAELGAFQIFGTGKYQGWPPQYDDRFFLPNPFRVAVCVL